MKEAPARIYIQREELHLTQESKLPDRELGWGTWRYWAPVHVTSNDQLAIVRTANEAFTLNQGTYSAKVCTVYVKRHGLVRADQFKHKARPGYLNDRRGVPISILVSFK